MGDQHPDDRQRKENGTEEAEISTHREMALQERPDMTEEEGDAKIVSRRSLLLASTSMRLNCSEDEKTTWRIETR